MHVYLLEAQVGRGPWTLYLSSHKHVEFEIDLFWEIVIQDRIHVVA